MEKINDNIRINGLCVYNYYSDTENRYFLSKILKIGYKKLTIEIKQDSQIIETNWKRVYLIVPFNDDVLYSKDDNNVLERNMPVFSLWKDEKGFYNGEFYFSELFSPSNDKNKIFIRFENEVDRLIDINALVFDIKVPAVLRVVPALKSFPLKIIKRSIKNKRKKIKIGNDRINNKEIEKSETLNNETFNDIYKNEELAKISGKIEFFGLEKNANYNGDELVEHNLTDGYILQTKYVKDLRVAPFLLI
ncbi:hypothetical protein MHBO_001683 [Bonamia ostreae]|uniref:Uncharacterized protein n=1 Tax=Bonamia ostreae TaxID=126728 RepID=A0ABV2AJS6_9EUKA